MSVSLSVSALLVERLLALVSPIFYAHHSGIGFSILTIFGSLSAAACLGVFIFVVQPPLELPADCRLLACLLHQTAVTMLLAVKIFLSCANLLLTIFLFVAMFRYTKARPASFRRVSKLNFIISMLILQTNFQANRIALYAAATEIFCAMAPFAAVAYGIFTGNKSLYEQATFITRLMSGTDALCSAIIYHAIVRRTSSRTKVSIIAQQSSRLTRSALQ